MRFLEILPSIPFILEGVKVTLLFSGTCFVFGFISGVLLTFIKLSSHRFLRFFGEAYTSIFRGTPLILQLSLCYFALPQILSIDLTAFQAGVLTFSLNSAAYISEILKAGVKSIDEGQKEAAFVLGISYTDMMKDLIWPQAFQRVLPSLVNETIDLLKESAIISTIGVSEIMRRANIISAEKFTYLEPLLIAGACYYILVMTLTIFSKILEKRLKYYD